MTKIPSGLSFLAAACSLVDAAAAHAQAAVAGPGTAVPAAVTADIGPAVTFGPSAVIWAPLLVIVAASVLALVVALAWPARRRADLDRGFVDPVGPRSAQLPAESRAEPANAASWVESDTAVDLRVSGNR